MVWVGHIESANAPVPSLPFALVQQRPNKTRFELKAQNQISLRVYDGIRGWKMRPTSSGKPELQPYTGEELSYAADGQSIAGPLMDYQARGITVTLDGIDEVEGHKTYRLNVKPPSGASHHVWIDAKTFLDIKSDREYRDGHGRSGTLSMFYRNYKTIEGLQIPLMIESGTDIAKASDKMVIDKVMLNPQLDEMTFAKPNLPGRGNVVSARETQRSAGTLRP
jgi:outer membrane lipoprotein-sorting protein